MIQYLIYFNFVLYLVAFAISLRRNGNFNTILVGLTYMAPLVPFGLTPGNEARFLVVSLLNTIFGIIELVIFVRTVKSGDVNFDKEFFQQLTGHVLPIIFALLGFSFLARAIEVPFSWMALTIITILFIFGCVMRVVAVSQLGKTGFKFDIVFRENQKLKTTQLYGLMRHPSYTAMMIVILAYAVTAHSWVFGLVGMLSAWFGFQYRIHYEEKALAKQFGDEYQDYRGSTGMWFPKLKA
jgi:protein-S-isoprenylcysteine O-methyltransferase Ste14